MDRKWWDVYFDEVARGFSGDRWGIINFNGIKRARLGACGNSGAGAILLASALGAKRIILLGYDCQLTGGKTHWHGDHPPGMQGNAGSLPKWPKQFLNAKKKLNGAEVINATRQTALKMFPRQRLEEALGCE